MTRRAFLALAAAPVGRSQGLDRRSVVSGNDVRLRKVDPYSPLSVGNGEFAFTVDVTGLQSPAATYEKTFPLCTQSQWGWHSFPLPEGLSPSQFRLEMFHTYGRQVGYATSSKRQEQLIRWLRENPHRLNLARTGFLLDRRPLVEGDLAEKRLAGQRPQLPKTQPALIPSWQRRAADRRGHDGRGLERLSGQDLAGPARGLPAVTVRISERRAARLQEDAAKWGQTAFFAIGCIGPLTTYKRRRWSVPIL